MSRIAVLSRLDAPLDVVGALVPCIIPGQALVKVICTGICGAQLQEISGAKGNEKYLPHALGHEACVRVQESFDTSLRGRKCVAHWRSNGRQKAECPTYFSHEHKDFRGGPIHTFGNQLIIDESRLTPVSDDVPDELCCLLGCCLSTALCVVENTAKVKAGESVLVIGCGGVGLACIKAAKMAGAYNVSGYDVKNKTHLLPKGTGGLFIGSISAGCKWPVIIDTTGSGLQLALQHIAPSGRIVLVGQGEQTVTIGKEMFAGDGISITATQAGGFTPSEDIPRFVHMWRQGILNADGLVTHRYSLDEINDAIAMLRSGNAGRIMIYP